MRLARGTEGNLCERRRYYPAGLRRAYMCTRTNSMYLYITWAIWCTWRGREAYPRAENGAMTIGALGYPYRARRERGSRGRSRGRIAFQISRYDYELHR